MTTDTLAALLENVLIAHGVDDTQRGPHSWRCDHPDRYPGYCTCIADIVVDLVAAVEAVAPPSDPAAPLVLDGPCDDQCRHPAPSDPAAPLREALTLTRDLFLDLGEVLAAAVYETDGERFICRMCDSDVTTAPHSDDCEVKHLREWTFAASKYPAPSDPAAPLRDAVIHAARDVNGLWFPQDDNDIGTDLTFWGPEAGEALRDLRDAIDAIDAHEDDLPVRTVTTPDGQVYRAAPPSDPAAPLREAARPILDRCLDVFDSADLDPESSFAMPVTIKARWVHALRAELEARP